MKSKNLDMQKSILLIVAVLVAGLLIGSAISTTGEAVRKPRVIIDDTGSSSGVACIKQITYAGTTIGAKISNNKIAYLERKNSVIELRLYDLLTNTDSNLLNFDIYWPNNNSLDYIHSESLRFNGNIIVWNQRGDNSNKDEINWYNIITGFRGKVPSNFNNEPIEFASYYWSIDAYGENIIFVGGYSGNLYRYNTRINSMVKEASTSDPGFSSHIPSIYGNNISYYYSNNAALFYRDKILYVKDITSGKIWNIYNVNSVIRERIKLPKVYKGYVIFSNFTSRENLVITSGTKIKKILKPNLARINTIDIDENWITWDEYDPIIPTKQDVFLYNIVTGMKKQITTNTYAVLPDISGNKLIYKDNANVKIYDLSCF